MLDRLIIALIVIVAAMVMTRSKEELDAAALTRALADAKVLAAEERASELEAELLTMELRALEAEAGQRALKDKVATVEKQLEQQAVRDGDPLMTPGEAMVLFGSIDPSLLQGHLRIVGRLAQECAVDTDGRGTIRLQLYLRADGNVTRVNSRLVGDRLRGIDRCLKAEASQWRFPRPDGGGAMLEWELHFNDPH